MDNKNVVQPYNGMNEKEQNADLCHNINELQKHYAK